MQEREISSLRLRASMSREFLSNLRICSSYNISQEVVLLSFIVNAAAASV